MLKMMRNIFRNNLCSLFFLFFIVKIDFISLIISFKHTRRTIIVLCIYFIISLSWVTQNVRGNYFCSQELMSRGATITLFIWVKSSQKRNYIRLLSINHLYVMAICSERRDRRWLCLLVQVRTLNRWLKKPANTRGWWDEFLFLSLSWARKSSEWRGSRRGGLGPQIFLVGNLKRAETLQSKRGILFQSTQTSFIFGF